MLGVKVTSKYVYNSTLKGSGDLDLKARSIKLVSKDKALFALYNHTQLSTPFLIAFQKRGPM